MSNTLESDFDKLVNKIKRHSFTFSDLEELKSVVEDLYFDHPGHPDNYESSDDWNDSGCSF